MSVALEKRLITVEEYHLMAQAGILKRSDRVELINGEIINMSPIGSIHAAVVNKISNFLKMLLMDQTIVSVQSPITLPPDNEPEPDICLLRPKEDYYSEALPTGIDIYVVIEVAGSTVAYDQEIKSPIYAKAGIPEYWLVDVNAMTIEVKSNPDNGIYKQTRIYEKSDKLVLKGFGKEVPIEKLL